MLEGNVNGTVILVPGYTTLPSYFKPSVTDERFRCLPAHEGVVRGVPTGCMLGGVLLSVQSVWVDVERRVVVCSQDMPPVTPLHRPADDGGEWFGVYLFICLLV